MKERGEPARSARAARAISFWLRVFLTGFWTLAFIAALIRGNWAFAVLALILGSLSGFWLSTLLEQRKDGQSRKPGESARRNGRLQQFGEASIRVDQELGD